MLSQIQNFCDQLAAGVNVDEWIAPKDMRDICKSTSLDEATCLIKAVGHWLSFDIVGKFGFGRTFDTLKETRNRFIVDVIRSMNMRTGIYAQYPDLTRLGLEIVQYPIQRGVRQRALAWVEDLRRTYMSDHEKRGVFSIIFAANGPGTEEQFSLAELTAELQFLITTGKQDTS